MLLKGLRCDVLSLSTSWRKSVYVFSMSEALIGQFAARWPWTVLWLEDVRVTQIHHTSHSALEFTSILDSAIHCLPTFPVSRLCIPPKWKQYDCLNCFPTFGESDHNMSDIFNTSNAQRVQSTVRELGGHVRCVHTGKVSEHEKDNCIAFDKRPSMCWVMKQMWDEEISLTTLHNANCLIYQQIQTLWCETFYVFSLFSPQWSMIYIVGERNREVCCLVSQAEMMDWVKQLLLLESH